MKNIDIAALGTCYVDINANGFGFDDHGIAGGVEVIGGAYETVPGGSAVNFCRMLSNLGLSTAFIGMSGNDEMGDVLADLLSSERVKPFVTRSDDVQTNVSFNMTSHSGEHILCVAGSANAALSFDAIQDKLEQAVADAKILYIGGCFKLEKLSADFKRLPALTKKHDALLAVDHGRLPSDIAAEMVDSVRMLVLEADYYFPSKDEFCSLWRVDAVEDGFRRLASDAPQLRVIVKDGPNGAYYYEDNIVKLVSAQKVSDVRDLTGAGDAFNAGVIIAVIGGHDIGDAVRHGCDVAAAKISRSPIPVLPPEGV